MNDLLYLFIEKCKITFTLYAYYMEILFITKKVQIILIKIIYKFLNHEYIFIKKIKLNGNYWWLYIRGQSRK